MWDTTTEFGQRIARRLAEEQIIWLVTTGQDGTPQPSPVWFVWDGATMRIFTKPDAPKVRNIQARPRIALHFNSDASGGDVIVFLGTAAVDPTTTAAHLLSAYLAKYGASIPALGMTPEQMGAVYATAIRVTLTKVRGF